MYLFTYLTLYLCIFLSMYLFTYEPFYLCTFLPMYLFTHVPFYLCTFLPMYLFIYVPMHLFTYVLFYLFTFVPMYLFTYLPLYLCIFLPMYLFIYVPNVCLSVHLFVRLCLYILHRSTSIFVFTSNPTLLRFNFLSFHFNWKVAPKTKWNFGLRRSPVRENANPLSTYDHMHLANVGTTSFERYHTCVIVF